MNGLANVRMLWNAVIAPTGGEGQQERMNNVDIGLCLIMDKSSF